MAHSILAIDPATNYGWAISVDFYGHGKLRKRKDHNGSKWCQFESWLIDMCELCEPSCIVIERAASQFARSALHHGKMIGIIELVAYRYNAIVVEVSAKQLKKFATKNGNASKEDMIAAARDHFNYNGDNDDEADALWLLHFARKKVLR